MRYLFGLWIYCFLSIYSNIVIKRYLLVKCYRLVLLYTKLYLYFLDIYVENIFSFKTSN